MYTIFTVNLGLPWISSTLPENINRPESSVSLALGETSFTLIEVVE